MRSRRSVCVSMLTVFFVMVISLGSAGALDFDDYDNTWHKVKFKIKAVCEDQGDEALSSVSDKDSAWIYIEDFDVAPNGSLVTQDNDGVWQANAITLNVIGGTADDMLLELDAPVSVIDDSPGDEVTVTVNALQVRLKGKENKDAELKSSKLTGVSGQATLDLGVGPDFVCYSSLAVSGNYKKNGPPDDVTEDTGLPPAP